MSNPCHIINEIGDLQSVIVKRPGKEVENMTPSTMHDLLFDDIPYLKKIQEEHDAFTHILRENGATVLYLEDLVTEAIKASEKEEEFIQQIVKESNISNKDYKNELIGYLKTLSTNNLVLKTMEGIRKDHILDVSYNVFHDSEKHSLFLLEPMPNLYYTRDPATVLDKGISLNKMTYAARKRESLYMEYILRYHPSLKNEGIITWRDRDSNTSIEGGDILVLNETSLLVGISERTSLEAIKELATLLFEKNSSFERVVGIEIPHVRAMMHLDTVFTMVDTNAFTIHPGIVQSNGTMPIYLIEKERTGSSIKLTKKYNLKETLEELIGEEVNLIQCGNGDPLDAPREQWNDGSNTLAIKPGVVVTYDRNHVSNTLMREQGIKVLEIPSGELSRGRGGPRCMSMPLKRKPVF